MARDGEVGVEVVFALPERQKLVAVSVPAHATVADAIEASRIDGEFPEHDLSACRVGIWGRLVDRDHRVEEGDRIELYRPLAIDPREARRKLAAEGKSMGGHPDDDAGD